MTPADPSSSCWAIETLIATYAELVDDGDFAGVGALLADAIFTGGAGSVSGSEAIGTAVSRSYFTALQALPDMALQPIVSGRYHDRFARSDGRWRCVERRVRAAFTDESGTAIWPSRLDINYLLLVAVRGQKSHEAEASAVRAGASLGPILGHLASGGRPTARFRAPWLS
jgi:hypothetical protein